MKILDNLLVSKAKATIQTSTTKALGSASVNSFEVLDSNSSELFSVKENGNTTIGGVLTITGAGASSFTGATSVSSLTVTSDLTVNGNTILGDTATDTTLINGLATVKTGVTKALGSPTNNAFKVVDSANADLFNVKTNGDTVIGGVLTVSGTGTSSFAGDVSIGGNLTVSGTSTASADLSGTDLTLTGNLVVNGNTTLGDAGTDTISLIGTTTATGNVVVNGAFNANGNIALGNAVGDTIGFNGTVTLPSTTTINGTSATSITTAVANSHAKNGDAGTSTATFYVGTTSGVAVKNNAGTFEVRNGGDTAYANFRCANLTVDGTTTTINSNTVNIGDSDLELNSDITTSASNSNGGITVKRLKVDNTTRADAKLNFNNSTGKWEATFGDILAVQTAQIPVKVVATIGDATNNSFVITHNLGTQDVQVGIVESASPFEMVYTTVKATSVNTITVQFGSIPTLNQYKVTIMG